MSAPATDAASWVALSELKPWVGNPRRNDVTVSKLVGSLTKYGWGRPLVVGFGDWGEMLVAGHTTLKAALRIERDNPGKVIRGAPGPAVAPVRRMFFPSEKEAKDYALVDNKIAETSEWDAGALASLAAEHDLVDLGWGEREIDDFQAVKRPDQRGGLVLGQKAASPDRKLMIELFIACQDTPTVEAALELAMSRGASNRGAALLMICNGYVAGVEGG